MAKVQRIYQMCKFYGNYFIKYTKKINHTTFTGSVALSYSRYYLL